MAIDPNALPRAVVLQYDLAEIVYPAGKMPWIRMTAFGGMGVRVDGSGHFAKNPAFLDDPHFQQAHRRAASSAGDSFKHVDDIRWHLHVALWAASHAARLDGDFVECGVNTGMLSTAICEWLDFDRLGKEFWLFDTFSGIPDQQMTEAERADIGGWHNRESYAECYALAQANFAPWSRCHLISGVVPESLAAFPEGRRVAYLSLDMNIVKPEIEAINFFWNRLLPGAVVLLDDYGWSSHKAQQHAFDAFAAEQGTTILHLPTGQGVMIR
jgi:O-methyltransferase